MEHHRPHRRAGPRARARRGSWPRSGCRRIILQNFGGTLAVDGLGIGLAAFGLLNPLFAAFIHVASELAFILNSTRLLPTALGAPAIPEFALIKREHSEVLLVLEEPLVAFTQRRSPNVPPRSGCPLCLPRRVWARAVSSPTERARPLPVDAWRPISTRFSKAPSRGDPCGEGHTVRAYRKSEDRSAHRRQRPMKPQRLARQGPVHGDPLHDHQGGTPCAGCFVRCKDRAWRTVRTSGCST